MGEVTTVGRRRGNLCNKEHWEKKMERKQTGVDGKEEKEKYRDEKENE